MTDTPTDTSTDAPGERTRWPEIVAATVLGIAAVLTAWSSYRASLIGDQVVQNYSEMQADLAEANDLYSNGDQQFAQEQQFFVTFALQANSGGEAAEANTAYLFEVMGPEMAAAVDWWASQDDDGPTTPFVEENPEFANLASSQAYAAGDEALARSEERRKVAEKADADSDRFELANVFFAVTLFVAGVATLVASRRITFGLLGLGIAMMAAGIVVVVTTPGWASLS